MPKMTAYRALYPGPQAQGRSSAAGRTKRAAMSYGEVGSGPLEEHEAVQSTVMNRVASGQKYWVDKGDELSEENVINAMHPRQYLAVGRPEFDKYIHGEVNNLGTRNAAEADRILRQTGKPTTDAVSFIVHPDGSPPTEEEIMHLGPNLISAGKVGRVYLYKLAPANRNR
jgi:hypothetical protein